MSVTQYNPDPHAHPGLHLIAVFEAFKGLLAIAAAAGLAVLGPQPLRAWVGGLIQRFHLDTQRGLLPDLLNAISPSAVRLIVVMGAVYALIRFFEAWGLWRARAWASWLGCIGSAIYLPFDSYALYRHPGWHTWAVLLINLVVVAVLGRDLFKRRTI